MYTCVLYMSLFIKTNYVTLLNIFIKHNIKYLFITIIYKNTHILLYNINIIILYNVYYIT